MAASIAALLLNCNSGSSCSASPCKQRRNQRDPITCSCCSRVVVKREGEPQILEGPAKKIKLEFPSEVKPELLQTSSEKSVPIAAVKIEDAGESLNKRCDKSLNKRCDKSLNRECNEKDNSDVRSVTLSENKRSGSNLYVNDVPNKNNKIVLYCKPSHKGPNRGKPWQNRTLSTIAYFNNNRSYRNKLPYSRNLGCSSVGYNSYFGFGRGSFPNSVSSYQNWNGFSSNNFQNCWSQSNLQNSQNQTYFNMRYCMNNSFKNFNNNNTVRAVQNQINNRRKLLPGIKANNVKNKCSLNDHKGLVATCSAPSLASEPVGGTSDSAVKQNSSLCEELDDGTSSNPSTDRKDMSSPAPDSPDAEPRAAPTDIPNENNLEYKEYADEGEGIELHKILCHSCLHPSNDVNTSESRDVEIIYNSCDIQICSEEENIPTTVDCESGLQVIKLDNGGEGTSQLKARKSPKKEQSCVLEELSGKECVSPRKIDCAEASKEKETLRKVVSSPTESQDELTYVRVCKCMSKNTTHDFKIHTTGEHNHDRNSSSARRTIDIIDCDEPLEVVEKPTNSSEAGKTFNDASEPDRKHETSTTVSKINLDDCKKSARDVLCLKIPNFKALCGDSQDNSGLSSVQNNANSVLETAGGEAIILDEHSDSKDADDLLIVSCTSATATRQSRPISRGKLRSLVTKKLKESVQTRNVIRVISLDVHESEQIKSIQRDSNDSSCDQEAVDISDMKENDALNDQCVSGKPVEQPINESKHKSSGESLRKKTLHVSRLNRDADVVMVVDDDSEKSNSPFDPFCNLDDDCFIIGKKCRENAASSSSSKLVAKEEDDTKKPVSHFDTTATSENELYSPVPDLHEDPGPENCIVSHDEASVKLEKKPATICPGASQCASPKTKSRGTSSLQNEAKLLVKQLGDQNKESSEGKDISMPKKISPEPCSTEAATLVDVICID